MVDNSGLEFIFHWAKRPPTSRTGYKAHLCTSLKQSLEASLFEEGNILTDAVQQIILSLLPGS